MESLADRLDACQEKLLDLYEKDSDQLVDQILHWHYVRLEHAMLYKARQAGLTHVGHQVVPTLSVTKGKARQAIEVHLALQGLQNSAYSHEPWTLQTTSLEMWNAHPAQCWKKKGRTITVKFDCEDLKAVEYVSWGHIYVQCAEDEQWYKVQGQVSYNGLYYELKGHKHYYVTFAQEALKYGESNKWEVHCGNTLIYEPCASVSSTQDVVREVSSAEATGRVPNATQPTATTRCVGPAQTASQVQTPPCKRQRVHRDRQQQQSQQPDTTENDPAGKRDCVNQWDNGDSNGAEHQGDNHNGYGAPVIHLKGDPNKLKCFRYRLKQSVPDLFVKASSTWHWACGGNTECAFVTLWYVDSNQRKQFLDRVNIPKGIQACVGYMTMFV
ncbi:E2 protein [Human papillomavirus type 72b]|uniref:Regulatory protein E2 n=1 Tax=Human papillomavirus type 72b TaxID=1484958 RepID=A0A059U7K1_HPV72|nr:E2 protein [Human papillomavirus type 72b]